MKILEILDTDLSENTTLIAIEFGPEDGDQADVTFGFEQEWNKEENKRIVTNCWVEKIDFNENQGNRVDISIFAHANINNEYIENIIN